MAFNAKNLQYDKREPAFLRKLKGDYGGLDGRHNVQIARPKKDRLKTGNDDDPLIVDEQGETVEKADYERRLKGGDDDGEPNGKDELGAGAKGDTKDEMAQQAERQKVTEIGNTANTKKRKTVKVVGGEDDEEDQVQEGAKKGKADLATKTVKGAPIKTDSNATKKKKGKKIKLSFDNPEG